MSAGLQGCVGTDPRSGGNRTLPQLLRDRARAHPDKVATRRKRLGIWQPTTWHDMYEKIRALANGLSRLGVQPGDRIAIIGENIVETYWLEYAALCCGARVVCLYPDVGAEELRGILDHCGAKLLLAEDQEQVDKALAVAADLQGLRHIVFVDGRGLWAEQNPLLMDFAALAIFGDDPAFEQTIDAGHADDPAVICYTSGTTGRPKGVLLSHRYLLGNAYRLMAAFALRPHAQYLSYISPAWAAEQICGLALGLLAPMIVSFAEKPETVRADMRELGPEFLLFTPRQWEMLAAEVQANMQDAASWRQSLYHWAVRAADRPATAWLADRLVLSGIRDNLGLSKNVAALSGGAGMSANMFRFFRTIGVRLSNLYGSTEFGLIAAHYGPQADPATMGQLLPTDPAEDAPLRLALSAEGELLIEQGGHFQGYWEGEVPPAGSILRTGDAVRLRPDGQLIFMDRLKDMRCLAGGEAFPPQFIENHLRASPMVKDAMVIGDERHAFVTALVNINAEIAGRFAERYGLAYGTFTELSQLPQIRAEISRLITDVNLLLTPATQVRRFATLPKELDADENELTRSRKLRRDRIEESFRDIIDGLYSGASRREARIKLRYRDGRESVLIVSVALDDIAGAAPSPRRVLGEAA
jgi:long-chain acyl-CoA synthetase